MRRPLRLSFSRVLATFPSSSLAAWIPLVYTSLYAFNEQLRRTTTPDTLSDAVLRFAIVEFIKIVLALSSYVWRRSRTEIPERRGGKGATDEEGQPLNHVNGFYEHTFDQSSSGRSGHRWQTAQSGPRLAGVFSITGIVMLAALQVHGRYSYTFAERFFGPFTTSLALSSSVLLVFLCLFSLSSWAVDIISFQAVLLQLCGFLVMKASLVTPITSPLLSHSVLFAAAFYAALASVLVSYIYRSQHRIPLEVLHGLLFTITFIVDIIAYTTYRPRDTSIHDIHFSTRDLLQCTTQAFVDVLWLMLIYYRDAPSAGILTSLGTAAHFLITSFTSGLLSPIVFVGSGLVVLGCTIYLFHRENEDDEDVLFKAGHGILLILQMLGATLFIVSGLYVVFSSAEVETSRFSVVKSLDISHIVSDSLITCHRKPLRSAAWYSYERSYHEFDDVLLIVFFSHARYDVNLDSYKEVYSEFFPNIVFVGPRSREDAGFDHSYDVLVDSYEAEEDLRDPLYYKMAGRMAHHMLYTAMDAHPCYKGYLWAPFDTLLNIPRLQQFNQDYFWYHSPFGTYVPNIALGDEVVNADKAHHAPPANLSPDPEIDLTSTWRGWQHGWWWGDPHLGLGVCYGAYKKVPQEMQDNMAALLNGTTRLIGGSADTVYIPGRQRESFLHVLGTFLETLCFLEIATPTAVHLVKPPEEPILYLDHWWIWQPPFNASFVRQQWDIGLEVDTFHTFHWGDTGTDGVWKGSPEHIPDVRQLLAESAARQKVDFPIRSLSLPPPAV